MPDLQWGRQNLQHLIVGCRDAGTVCFPASLEEQAIPDATTLGRGKVILLNCLYPSALPQTYFCSF